MVVEPLLRFRHLQYLENLQYFHYHLDLVLIHCSICFFFATADTNINTNKYGIETVDKLLQTIENLRSLRPSINSTLTPASSNMLQKGARYYFNDMERKSKQCKADTRFVSRMLAQKILENNNNNPVNRQDVADI